MNKAAAVDPKRRDGHPGILASCPNLAANAPANHAHSVALFAMYYNFVRIHKTLRTIPAMAAKVTERLLEMSDIVDVLEG